MSIALITDAAGQLVVTGVEVVIGARDPQAAAAAVSELAGAGGYAESLDIADPESVHRAATIPGKASGCWIS
jgi:hypothetical protein